MNKLSLGMASGLLAAVMLVTPAFAWTFGLTGSGKCQPNGSFLITWVVNNPENEVLNVTSSTDTSVIPVGTQSPVGTKNYTQVADGTKPGNFSLTIKGNFPSDQTIRTSSKTVKLKNACEQPVTPPEQPPVIPPTNGGMGGGTTTPAPTPTVTVAQPQVVTPVGAVNAGNGGASKALSFASVTGLIGSVIALGFGIRGLKKQS